MFCRKQYFNLVWIYVFQKGWLIEKVYLIKKATLLLISNLSNMWVYIPKTQFSSLRKPPGLLCFHQVFLLRLLCQMIRKLIHLNTSTLTVSTFQIIVTKDEFWYPKDISQTMPMQSYLQRFLVTIPSHPSPYITLG